MKLEEDGEGERDICTELAVVDAKPLAGREYDRVGEMRAGLFCEYRRFPWLDVVTESGGVPEKTRFIGCSHFPVVDVGEGG